jgi:hypothetical protein
MNRLRDSALPHDAARTTAMDEKGAVRELGHRPAASGRLLAHSFAAASAAKRPQNGQVE